MASAAAKKRSVLFPKKILLHGLLTPAVATSEGKGGRGKIDWRPFFWTAVKRNRDRGKCSSFSSDSVNCTKNLGENELVVSPSFSLVPRKKWRKGLKTAQKERCEEIGATRKNLLVRYCLSKTTHSPYLHQDTLTQHLWNRKSLLDPRLLRLVRISHAAWNNRYRRDR